MQPRFLHKATSAACGALLALTALAPMPTAPTAYAVPITASFDNNVPVAIPDGGMVESQVAVAGVAGPLTKVTVSVYVVHPFTGDLVVTLIGPDGTAVVLSQENAGEGENFGNATQPLTERVTFDDEAVEAIYDSEGPYVGSYQPEEPLGDMFNGKADAAVNGTWTLRIEDLEAEDVGSLQAWTLNLTSDAP